MMGEIVLEDRVMIHFAHSSREMFEWYDIISLLWLRNLLRVTGSMTRSFSGSLGSSSSDEEDEEKSSLGSSSGRVMSARLALRK